MTCWFISLERVECARREWNEHAPVVDTKVESIPEITCFHGSHPHQPPRALQAMSIDFPSTNSPINRTAKSLTRELVEPLLEAKCQECASSLSFHVKTELH
jgi:hypothetical protein